MDKVQRYDFGCVGNNYHDEVILDEYGDYVLYEDYKNIADECERMQKDYEELIMAVRNTILMNRGTKLL